MDERDIEILTFLQRDGRTPFTEIAKSLGVTEGTIRNRVSKLQKKKALQIIGLVDPHRLGYEAPAMFGLSVHPPNLEEVAVTLADLPEISYLIMVSGEFDLIVEGMFPTRQELARFLRETLPNIDGIRRVETFTILHTYKMALGAQPVLTGEEGSGEENGSSS